MKSHSKTYEQYCSILKKNVTVEETAYHDGTKVLNCTMKLLCKSCKNNILKCRFENCKEKAELK